MGEVFEKPSKDALVFRYNPLHGQKLEVVCPLFITLMKLFLMCKELWLIKELIKTKTPFFL